MSMLKLIQRQPKNPGSQEIISFEKECKTISFNKIKFNQRSEPQKKEDKIIITNFSEMGCEIIGIMYCIPQIIQKFPGKYKICIGWYGRDYLYRHLVDEFWEVKEEYQWLREYCRAFHHTSKNLRKVERSLRSQGRIVTTEQLGRWSMSVTCNNCKLVWGDAHFNKYCPTCKGEDIQQSIYGDVEAARKTVCRIPKPSQEKIKLAEKYTKENTVGIFARGRKCYGRNLTPEFYVTLISTFKEMGYNVIWLGEKQSTQPCPVNDVLDFSRMEESRDLELTLAIISKLKFTIQFWTASTRLASLVDTPWILFESPDQILANGQEGYRISLTTFGRRKIVYSDFLNVYNDIPASIDVVKQAIGEINNNNWQDMIGLVGNEIAVKAMIDYNNKNPKLIN